MTATEDPPAGDADDDEPTADTEGMGDEPPPADSEGGDDG